MKKSLINFKKVWDAFDTWAYSEFNYHVDALSPTGKKLIAREINRQLKSNKKGKK